MVSLGVADEERKPGWFIVAAVAAFVLAFNVPLVESTSPNARWIMSGMYAFGIGVLFLLAYFFENESLVFRGLMWVCEHFSSPRSRKMAFFYAALAGTLGTVAILQGLGVINVARHA